MKRLSVLTYVFVWLTMPSALGQQVFYVSPTGIGDGLSQSNPASLESVRQKVQTAVRKMTGDIVVNLLGGRYDLTSTWELTASDGGNNGFNVIYKAMPGQKPVISGGQDISGGWMPTNIKGIYSKNVGTSADSRQLYVNFVRAIRARSTDASGWSESGDGYNCPETVASWGNITSVEVVSYKEWKCHRGPIASVSGTHVVMAQPYWNNLHKQYDGPPVWIENAFELLDSEGEWYLNHSTGIIYYKPRNREDMNTAVVILPRLETLIRGSNVSNLQFKGITFSYATWLFPNSNTGFPNLQADAIYSGEGKRGLQIPGNIVFDHAKNIVFDSDCFMHLGVTGLQLYTGCQNCTVRNCFFTDISASGISLGNITTPNPSDADLVKDNTIDNNLITAIGEEYKGCVGIFVGYTDHTVITHNEVCNVPYTGISVGWGWSHSLSSLRNNHIDNNYVHGFIKALRDAGGIYTLSNQPNSTCSFNFIDNYTDPPSHGFWNGLYFDEGTEGYTINSNVIIVPQARDIPWIGFQSVGSKSYNNNADNNYTNRDTTIIPNRQPASYTVSGTDRKVTNTSTNTHFVPDLNWPPEAYEIIKNAGRRSLKN